MIILSVYLAIGLT